MVCSPAKYKMILKAVACHTVTMTIPIQAVFSLPKILKARPLIPAFDIKSGKILEKK
ncbi:hypothetical protein D3C87_2203070 [compost metagenome]